MKKISIMELKSMSDSEIRIKVANIMGWEKDEKNSTVWNNINGVVQNYDPPLYASDLNAI